MLGAFRRRAGDGPKSSCAPAARSRGPPTPGHNRFRLVGAIGQLPHVTGGVGPLGPAGGHQVSRDGSIVGMRTVQFDRQFDRLRTAAPNGATSTARRFAGPSLRGGSHRRADLPPGALHRAPARRIGIFAAIVIMLIAFGSVVAMGLPILTALLGVGIGYGLVACSAS